MVHPSQAVLRAAAVEGHLLLVAVERQIRAVLEERVSLLLSLEHLSHMVAVVVVRAIPLVVLVVQAVEVRDDQERQARELAVLPILVVAVVVQQQPLTLVVLVVPAS